MTPPPADYTEIALFCFRHDPPASVHRYRWIQSSGVWVSTASGAWSVVGGADDLSSPEAIADAPAGREYWNIKCHSPGCHYRVTMVERVGQIALTALAANLAAAKHLPGAPVPLPALQRIYESVSGTLHP